MIELTVPGVGELHLEHLVLDLNGTIAQDGEVLPGVTERLGDIAQRLDVHLLSADTRGLAADTAHQLGVHLHRVSSGQEQEQKREFVAGLGADTVIAMGNGSNDSQMLREAALGIAVMGSEGLAVAALHAADVVVACIQDALDLIGHPQRLIATTRR